MKVTIAITPEIYEAILADCNRYRTQTDTDLIRYETYAFLQSVAETVQKKQTECQTEIDALQEAYERTWLKPTDKSIWDEMFPVDETDKHDDL